MELDAQYEIKEACGVFGIYDFSGNDVAPSIYYGLSDRKSTRLNSSHSHASRMPSSA